MSVYTANGPAKFNRGHPVTDLIMNLVSGPLTLTNALQAIGFVNADDGYVYRADLSGFTQVRLTGRVKTASASVNSPKIQLKYSASYTLTVGNYLDLGTSSVEFSMFTGAANADSGWINLVAGAQIDDCYLGLMNIGGDGAADPVIANVMAHFR